MLVWAWASSLGKDGGARLTPVVENRARFTLFGGGVLAIFPPERRGAAAAAREGVPPSLRAPPPGSSRAPPGKAERVEDRLRSLGDVLVGTRPDCPMAPPGRRGAAADAREGVPPSSRAPPGSFRAPPGKAERVENSFVLGTRPDRAARALGEDMVDGGGGVLVFLWC